MNTVKSIALFLLLNAVIGLPFSFLFYGKVSLSFLIPVLIVNGIITYLNPYFVGREAKERLKKITVELETDEKLKAESAANFITPERAVVGKLVLTDKRLIFKSTELHLKNYRSVLLSQILAVSLKKKGHFGNFIKGQILEILSDREFYKFAAESSDNWTRLLTELNSQFNK